MKLCTKNYENPSIFVKVTAKKSVALFFLDTVYNGLLFCGFNMLSKGLRATCAGRMSMSVHPSFIARPLFAFRDHFSKN